MLSDLLTRPKNSFLFGHGETAAAGQPVGRGRAVCFVEEQKSRVRCGVKEPHSFSALPHFFAFFSPPGWYFSGPHRNSIVTVRVVDGGGFRLDVWRLGARQQRYLRNALLGGPFLWGGQLRESKPPESLLPSPRFRSPQEPPLPSGVC